MKKLYKIILFIVWLSVGYLSHLNPITETKEILPVILICLWLYLTYALSVTVIFTREFILFSRNNGELQHEYLIGFHCLLLTSFIFLSLAFSFFVLSEIEAIRWIFSIVPIALVIVLSFYFVKLLPYDFRIAGMFSFSLIPTISICIPLLWNHPSSGLFPMDHSTIMLLIFGFSIISFFIFYLTKENTIKTPIKSTEKKSHKEVSSLNY